MDYEKGGLQKDYYGPDEVARRECPYCDSADYSDIYKERGNIGVVKCRSCGLIYTNPMVKAPEKNYWGEEKKYYEEARLIFNGRARHHRDPNYLQDIKIIEKAKPEGNFLDIGTNMGFFLRHARNRKWEVYGVEPSPALSGMARKYFGLNVKTAYLEEAGFKDSFFDIITMTDVFEHIAVPRRMLSQVRGLLKEGGILFIKVPNASYSLLKLRLAKLSGRLKDYDIFDSYEHITHYTHTSLRKMLEGCGFSVKSSFIGRPIHLPAWHKHVGQYYQYPSPWSMDIKNHLLRQAFYWISKAEFMLRFGRIGCFAPNIIIIAQKNKNNQKNY